MKSITAWSGPVALGLAALLLAGCQGPADEPSGSVATSDVETPEPVHTQGQCTDEPEQRDGYTAPRSVLCLGATARLPYYARDGADPVPVEVTVTAVEASADRESEIGHREREEFPRYLFRYTATAEQDTTASADPWYILGGMAIEDGDGGRVATVDLADCEGLPRELPAGEGAVGCQWTAVDPGATITGVVWMSVHDERYTRFGDEVRWLLDEPITVPGA